MMTTIEVSDFFQLLAKQQSQLVLTATNSTPEIIIILKEIHRIIKKCSAQIPDPRFLSNHEQEILFSILKSLALILIDDTSLADVMLLCGTCISLLVVTLFHPEFSTQFLIYMYCYFNKKYSGTKKISSSFKESTKKEISEHIKLFIFSTDPHIPVFLECNDECTIEDKKLIIPSFQQIAILNGIVSCRVPSLLSFKSKFCENKPFVIFIFDAIHLCCLSPSVHQYHAFNVLLNWMKMCEASGLAFSGNENIFFKTNGNIVQKVLCLLESNWQSPIKGINGFVKEMYKILIILSKQEFQKVGSDDIQLVPFLLKKSMMLSWKAKGKYFMLSAVFQHTHYLKFFEDNPDAPSKIMFNLKANYIASSVAEVYKVIVSNMKNSDSTDDFYSEWCKWWRTPIMDCLGSKDKLLIQNVTNNILPWTMKTCPQSYDLMMEVAYLGDCDSIKLLLIRIAKENFSHTLGEKELILIDKNLHHHDIQTRTEILSILCCSTKKSEPVKARELDILKCFISENLNIDSAPFHQHLLSHLRTLLARIRDSIAQEYRSGIHNSNGVIDFTQLEFVDWLAHSAIQNTFPGACYQRRRVSLQILNVIFDVYIQSTLGFRRKEKPSKSVELVIEWAQKNNLLLFFSDDTLSYILPCITDFTDEIRALCANLLLQYSTWPVIKNFHDFNEVPILEFSLSLCNHPDYRNNDGGAHICCIIFRRLCGSLQKNQIMQALQFLKHLVSTATLHLASAKEDFLSAATEKPIHGILLALQYCVSNSKDFMASSYPLQEQETLSFLKDLISVCFDTVQYVLRIMKGNNENFNCPSFLDIGNALENLVLSKKTFANNSTLDDAKFDDTSLDYSSLCDLLLSCCWHCIKNSCFLLCEVSVSVLSINIENTEKKQMLHEMSKILSSILITCRHRGVVEACCEALNKFCANLLNDKPIYEDITMGLLKSVFETLEDTSKISVTRRSAGLPLLFQAVVSSEENGINRRLLTYTVENLLHLINKALPPEETISEKTDLPQAHSYHILKALVLDASLAQCILPYFDSIIPACVSGFSSPVWAIRNGALQLFGVILPRVCGQKKVRDDDSEHNKVSAFELFARCPSLKTYLLQELKKCVKFHQEKCLCSELVPVLSLLVKLMPEQEDQREFMIEFTPLLISLLGIPVWKVRDLVSSALSVMLSTAEIFNLLENNLDALRRSDESINKIHSVLLIVKKYSKRNCKKIVPNDSSMLKCLQDMLPLVDNTVKCPLLSGMIIDIVLSFSETKKDLTILNCIDNCKTSNSSSQDQEVGIVFYESKAVLAHLKLCSILDLPTSLKNVSSKNKHIQTVCIQFLSDKLNSDRVTDLFSTPDNLNYWRDIFISVTDYVSPVRHPSVIQAALEFMINLCSDWSTGKMILNSVIHSVVECLLCHLDMHSSLSVSALSFTMWSICIRSILEQPDQKLFLEEWNLLFSCYCQPRSTDILRMQAAKSLAILGPPLARYLACSIEDGKDTFVHTFISLCEGSLLLLQDEDQEIRNEACKFPSNIPHNYSLQASVLQFNIGIKVVFQYMLHVLHSQSFYILYLWNRLQSYPSSAKVLQSCNKLKKINLFEQEYVNVFSEPHQILYHYLTNCKTVLLHLRKKDYKLYLEKMCIFLRDLKMELQDVCSILSSVNAKTLNQSFTYHHQAFLALKKLRCQVESLMQQKDTVKADDPLLCDLNELNLQWSNVEKLLPSVTCWFLNQL